METVSWFDAVEFCNTLSAQDGLEAYYTLSKVKREEGAIKSARVSTTSGNGYRLPTEAEWEYSCRAGSTTLWHTGNAQASLNEAGWWGASETPAGNSEQRTNRVGQKTKNAFGLYDMHGNVREWCFDVYDDTAYGKRLGATHDPVVTRDPEMTREFEYRVHRGGSWDSLAWDTRSAFRYGNYPDFRDYNLGFRVVR